MHRISVYQVCCAALILTEPSSTALTRKPQVDGFAAAPKLVQSYANVN